MDRQMRPSSWHEFATLPETVSLMRLRRHLDAMPGGMLVDIACDRLNEAALIFTFRGHRFGVDLHELQFRFNVEDANCPDDVLGEVLAYIRQFVQPSPRVAGH